MNRHTSPCLTAINDHYLCSIVGKEGLWKEEKFEMRRDCYGKLVCYEEEGMQGG